MHNNPLKTPLLDIVNELLWDEYADVGEFYDTIYSKEKVTPEPFHLFRAFEGMTIEDVKLIVVGQDPYPGICKETGRLVANGLAFFTDTPCFPYSLEQLLHPYIFNYDFEIDATGENIKKQGVLLLNVRLTTRIGEPGAHKGKRQEEFVVSVIDKIIAAYNEREVFDESVKRVSPGVISFGTEADDALKAARIHLKTRYDSFPHPASLRYRQNDIPYIRKFVKWYERAQEFAPTVQWIKLV